MKNGDKVVLKGFGPMSAFGKFEGIEGEVIETGKSAGGQFNYVRVILSSGQELSVGLDYVHPRAGS